VRNLSSSSFFPYAWRAAVPVGPPIHRRIPRSTSGPAATTAKTTAIPTYNNTSLGRSIILMPQAITPYPTTTKTPVSTHFPYLLTCPPLPYVVLSGNCQRRILWMLQPTDGCWLYSEPANINDRPNLEPAISKLYTRLHCPPHTHLDP